jgi:hypothetical protein
VSEADRTGVACEHYWNRFGRLSGGLYLNRGWRKDDVDIRANQIGRELWQLVGPFGPSEFDDEIISFDVAQIAQARPKCLNAGRVTRNRKQAKKADPRNFTDLLCARRKRPGGCGSADKCDELPSPHGSPPSRDHTVPHARQARSAGKGQPFIAAAGSSATRAEPSHRMIGSGGLRVYCTHFDLSQDRDFALL